MQRFRRHLDRYSSNLSRSFQSTPSYWTPRLITIFRRCHGFAFFFATISYFTSCSCIVPSSSKSSKRSRISTKIPLDASSSTLPVRSRGPVKVNNLHTPPPLSPSFHHSILERTKERNNSRRISPRNFFLFSKIHSPLPSLQNSHEGIINLPIILLVPSISLTVIILQRQFLLASSSKPFEQNLLPPPFEALFHSLLPIPSIRIVQFQLWCNTDGARAKRHRSTAAV